MMVMMARKAERSEKAMLTVMSGVRERREGSLSLEGRGMGRGGEAEACMRGAMSGSK